MAPLFRIGEAIVHQGKRDRKLINSIKINRLQIEIQTKMAIKSKVIRKKMEWQDRINNQFNNLNRIILAIKTSEKI